MEYGVVNERVVVAAQNFCGLIRGADKRGRVRHWRFRTPPSYVWRVLTLKLPKTPLSNPNSIIPSVSYLFSWYTNSMFNLYIQYYIQSRWIFLKRLSSNAAFPPLMRWLVFWDRPPFYWWSEEKSTVQSTLIFRFPYTQRKACWT